MAGKTPLHNVAIVGAYNTVQSRRLDGYTSVGIVLDAIRGALDDAGLTVHDVDGVNCSAGIPPTHTANDFVHLFGGRPTWVGSGGTGVYAVQEAAAAIAAGLCHTVVIAAGQAGAYVEREKTAPWTRPTNEFVECWGLYTAAEFALIAQRHMHQYGTQPEHLAEVAATIRTNGARNPAAIYTGIGEVTPQDVLNSRMVAEPYHLLDCATTSEGGAAVVLTTAERARDLPCQPAHILGAGSERTGPAYVTAPVWDRYGNTGEHAANVAFGMAGIERTDVDVCEFYDPFSFEIIRQFEAFGFCPVGEGGPFVMDGRIKTDGQYPICTDGGTMSHSHPGSAQFIQKIVAAVSQLRGRSGERQVPDAHIAMATNGGAAALFMDALLLGDAPA